MTEAPSDGAEVTAERAWAESELAGSGNGEAAPAGGAAPVPLFGDPLLENASPSEREGPRRPRRTAGLPADGMAIAALVLSLVGLHLVGVILGHLALSRIRRAGAGGRGLAIAALVLGYAGLALALAWWTVYFSWLAPVVTLPG